MAKAKAKAKAAAKREVGRPTSYRPEFCRAVVEAREIRAQGATDTVIAAAFDVDPVTIYRWREQHPEFAAACDQAKDTADDLVETSMFQRARGYTHDAVKIFMPAGAPAPVYAPYTERYAPDTGAAMNWLKNRRPERWRDRIEHTGADGGPIELTWLAHEPGAIAPAAQPGDLARDVTPRTAEATPAPALLDGEAIAVEWSDDAKPDKPKVKR